uniref:Immunoglobulin V-set domain-containing protein n=1 Tax=Gasterosteus aculeatus aculeatus TaxID=481459 RepID=A0AAQ4NQD3_GASAC
MIHSNNPIYTAIWPDVLLMTTAGVSGVTVVTQKPVVAVTTGETVSIDCNLGTVTNYPALWYKQIPGGVPQFVISFHHDWSSPTYGTGFSSSKVGITVIYTVTKTSSLSTSAF